MSPVCKKCRNYVMDFPCPHCGGDLTFTDRKPDEIRPIIPVDLQESFTEPPPPVSNSESSNIPPYQPPMSPQPKSQAAPAQTPYVPPPPASPPHIKMPPKAPPPSIKQKSAQVPPPAPTIPSVTISKDTSGTTIPIDNINDHFKRLEYHLKEIDSRQKRYESQAKKFESNFKEIDNKLKKIEKSLKILLKTNQKLESIHKDASKDLKNAL